MVDSLRAREGGFYGAPSIARLALCAAAAVAALGVPRAAWAAKPVVVNSNSGAPVAKANSGQAKATAGKPASVAPIKGKRNDHVDANPKAPDRADARQEDTKGAQGKLNKDAETLAKAKLAKDAGIAAKAKVAKEAEASAAKAKLAKAEADARAAAKVAAEAKAAAERRRAEIAKRVAGLGPMSVGLPNTGFLVNGVSMQTTQDWVVTLPSHGYGTEETVKQLGTCITATRAAYPGAPRVMLGSLSAQGGGKLPPHKSHRTGRDADVYFFRQPGAPWGKAASKEDIDLPRTWALLRCFVTKADVDMVLIDRKVQAWLEEYALRIGEPPEWIETLFHDRPHTKSALVRHVPGHVAHMHVRFVSPKARRLGATNYRDLVAAGLVAERVEQVEHKVGKGDTLLGLAKRYKLRVEEIQSLNQLKGSVIRLGQILTMKQGKPIEGIEAPIGGPGRALPPQPCEPGPVACHAGLAIPQRIRVGADVGASQDRAFLGTTLP